MRLLVRSGAGIELGEQECHLKRRRVMGAAGTTKIVVDVLCQVKGGGVMAGEVAGADQALAKSEGGSEGP